MHDKDISYIELEPEFDTSGHFSDKNIKPGKVRHKWRT